MDKNILLIISLAVSYTGGTVQKDSCLPDCNGKDPLDMVSDPMNCTKYYVCTAKGIVNQDYHFTCPRGNVFNYRLGRCIPDAPCVTPCSTSIPAHVNPSATTTASKALPSTQPSPKYKATPTTDCTNSIICTEIGYVAKCHSCKQDYYKCTAVNTEGIVQTCPGELVFNPDPSYRYCILLADCPTVKPVTTTTPNDCITSLVCTAVGNFPRCKSCQQEYFHCTTVGAAGIVRQCAENLVFNTVSAFPYCVLPNDCPYQPLK
nr:uncharacterized protein LOC128688646 [Cherax quadricarinatus]